MQEATGPAGHWFYGHLMDLRDDSLGTLMRAFREHGDVSRLRFGPFRIYLLAHPDHIETVLRSNYQNFDKHLPTYRQLQSILGLGLLTSDGELWQRHRRIAQPAFHKGRLASFGPTMVESAEGMAARWSTLASQGGRTDLHEEMMALALEVAAKTLLGSGLRSGETQAVGEALGSLLHEFHRRLHKLVRFPEWVPTRGHRAMGRAKATLNGVVRRIITEQRQLHGTATADIASVEDASGGSCPFRGTDDHLLRRLMAARDDESGAALDDHELRDEVMTMFLAGHETTANALTWTWILLARHPEAAQRLRQELHRELGDRPPTAEDLPRLPWTRQVIEESMRLYPPAWVVERRVRADTVLGGYRIPRNSVVLMSPWVTHRHPGLWSDPETFDPERFSPENVQGRHRNAYFPFSFGPRVCIGAGFARLEMPLLLATLAQRFEVLLDEPEALELDPNITLRPRHGVPITIRKLA